jgi:hypothetical protein
VLANILKVVLPHIIFLNQSSFILGRLITDNMLAVYKTLHTMHLRMYGKEGFMTIKLNMSKAYDRVKWHFLEAVMKHMGFDNKGIQLIMICMSTTSCAVLVNGIPSWRIVPTRGIRQGDPISPYLFLICVEVLSALLTQAKNSNHLSRVPISKTSPRINHLFFFFFFFCI